MDPCRSLSAHALPCDRLADRRPTDHATQSITTGRIYVRSTAMRPEKAKGLKTKTDLLSRYGARKSPRSQSRGRKRVYGALEGFAKQVRF